MRKWMRERLKRRTKEPEKSGKEAAPAPLQPAFYDTATTRDVTPAEVKESEPKSGRSKPYLPSAEERLARQDRVRQNEGHQNEKPKKSTPGTAELRPGLSDNARPSRRRRRGRGGRGRTRQTASPSTQGAPAEGTPSPSAPASDTSETTAPAAATPTATPQHPSKGVVVLAIGLPGSGKSSWFKRHEIMPLSSDLLRALLFDDATEQRFQDLIFSNLRSMLKARLIARRPTNYVDATNLTPHERQNWIKLAKDYGYEAQAVFFDVPVEVCLERNQRRQRIVPEDVMRRMAAKLRAPTFQEGFTKITVVKVKKKEGEAAAG
jgi:predicted kinase